MPLVIYVCLAPCIAWPLYNAILFQPSHGLESETEWCKIESDFAVKREMISFPAADGTDIEAWFLRLPDAKRVFLVSQGKGGSLYRRAGMARMLLRCGGSVLLYNYRGFGKSGGSPSLDGVCLDAIGAHDYLVQRQGFSSGSIIAYGESFGTGVTGQLVSKRKVGGVILQSGFSSLLRASKDCLPWLQIYPRYCFPNQIMDNVAVFSKDHPPLLLVHGRKDRLVQCKNAEDLFSAAAAPKTLLILHEGDHGSFGKGNEYFVAMQNFLRKHHL